jgi:hypothetical protein
LRGGVPAGEAVEEREVEGRIATAFGHWCPFDVSVGAGTRMPRGGARAGIACVHRRGRSVCASSSWISSRASQSLANDGGRVRLLDLNSRIPEALKTLPMAEPEVRDGQARQ